MNSSVVQMFHCRLALFHAAQCCGQGSQLDGFPFWSIHPLSCLRIKRDLRNGGTKAWTHPTQKWNWFRRPLWSTTWQKKTQICSPSLSLSLTLQSELPESGNQGLSLHLQVRQCRWGRSSRAAGEAEPPSSPRSSGFAPDQLFSGPKEGMPLLRGRSVLRVLLEHMCTVWFHS